MIAFKEGFTWCVIEKSVLINRSKDAFRCKSILMMLITSRRVKCHDLRHMFKSAFPPSAEVGGVYVAPTARYEAAVIAGQLQALYLSPSLHETTIGDYLNKHPEVIKRAFNTDYFVYEPYLLWLEHDGSVEDTAINPDLLVRRPDGFFDIYDLKTAWCAPHLAGQSAGGFRH